MQTKQYVLNRETGKVELHFEKSEYQSLTEQQKAELKRFFLWSPSRSAWVSRSTNNHYMAIRIAEKLGFTDGGKIGERLSFAEQLERKAEKAEARAERYEKYAENAEKRAEMLQAEMNEHLRNHDIAFFTQPIIAGHAGSERFARQRQRIYDRYHKGFEEYRKSEYFRQKAMTAQQTASMAQLKDKTYLNNRIEECNANIRKYEKLIVTAEEQNNEKWLESLLEKMEYEIDKLAFFQNCLDELGGIQYNKDNIKPGYLVKIRGYWDVVVKANTKTVEVKSSYVPYTLKYPYAEIQEVKIPENWTEQKQIIENPFNVGDILVRHNVAGNIIIAAFKVVKVTEKSVTIQQIAIEDGKPIKDKFINDKQERRQIKKNTKNEYVVNYDNWYLYPYKQKENEQSA
jgi:hypothetical protein